MADRLERSAVQVGLAAADRRMLVRCFLDLAMPPRLAEWPDGRHPSVLHPGRTALILMDDCAMRDPALLAAAMAFDSERADLTAAAADGPTVVELAGERAGDVLATLPSASLDDEELIEQLVTLEPAVLDVALAERLDHVRHVHLVGPRELWAATHRQVTAVYLPLSARAHQRLEQRYHAWAEAIARRLARPDRRT